MASLPSASPVACVRSALGSVGGWPSALETFMECLMYAGSGTQGRSQPFVKRRGAV